MKNNLSDLMCLDIYLSDQRNKVLSDIKDHIESSKSGPKPLMSWDIFIENYHQQLSAARKRTEMEQVISFAEKFDWQNDIRSAFSENDYDALIITDANRKIIWVNEGFSTMTGYSKSYAIHKTPNFLQGEKTSVQTKNRFKKKIVNDKPFKDIIVNYRKDKTTYSCEVKIIPLYNEKTTHFLAFEKEVG